LEFQIYTDIKRPDWVSWWRRSRFSSSMLVTHTHLFTNWTSGL